MRQPGGWRFFRKAQTCQLSSAFQFRSQLEVDLLELGGGKDVRVEIPVNEEDRCMVGLQGQQSPSIFGDDTFGFGEVERSVRAGSVTDDEWQSRVFRASFPLAVGAVQARCPGCRRYEQPCAVRLEGLAFRDFSFSAVVKF